MKESWSEQRKKWWEEDVNNMEVHFKNYIKNQIKELQELLKDPVAMRGLAETAVKNGFEADKKSK